MESPSDSPKILKARVWTMSKRFVGIPEKSDFHIIVERIPALKTGEYLAKAVYISIDPHIRAITDELPVGSAIPGIQIASVVESLNEKFPVGAYVHGAFGWRTLTVDKGQTRSVPTYVLPDYLNDKSMEVSYGLSLLGVPGLAAYFGLTEVLKPRRGETLVVSSVAGGVGNFAAQIAKKILGCNVIGITSRDNKAKWCKDRGGIDQTISYMDQDVVEQLNKFAPEGVDYYFDTVGGDIANSVLSCMNDNGKIAQCGAISGYCNDVPAHLNQLEIIEKELKVEGFQVTRWKDRWFEAIDQLYSYHVGKRMSTYPPVYAAGFESIPDEFIRLFRSFNVGKVVVIVPSNVL
ncbi:unnamed protein product [Acanthoscelides obtectus]|uniref:15-oxoprostaglandin 13-reductase n=1 Tax=Acanthoscelides obtectus TaxID=200917 RepID=A0A9P0L3P8_ACAOB|nr:unnamed protein product [Acanthoscelides obtectus]CAK1676129.1 Prostaglandin reductase 1 [Acanthoscelides obtectus]